MCNLNENIFALCNERGITPGALCGELGFRRSVLSDLKNGRKKSLDTTTLMKIAEYFNVSVDYLLTGAETKKAPTKEGERDHAIDYIDNELKEYLDELRTRPEICCVSFGGSNTPSSTNPR